jgi:glyoxylase-like metal-dependent hydrolase (beta-lactamase superfamily II)
LPSTNPQPTYLGRRELLDGSRQYRVLHVPFPVDPSPMTRIEVPECDLVGIRAANPGPFTLTGTNSWILGRDPAWLVDPGPLIGDHVDELTAEIAGRGGLGGIALTHDHADHAAAVGAIRARFPDAPLAGARGEVDVLLSEGSRFGPLEALATPGHSPDHLAFVTGGSGGEGGGELIFSGDAVLGEGSVFITPDPGALASYLKALERLRQRELVLLCPGHGPLVHDPAAKLEEYISHRLERESRLIAALDAGRRTFDELLEDVWSDAPVALRPAAAATLAAHLDKLEEEGRLPDGVERPQISL